MVSILLSGTLSRTVAIVVVATASLVSAQAASLVGGQTSVALDSGTVGALTGLGFTIAPIAPATLDGTTAAFPITAATDTEIDHSGGLSFTKTGTTAGIQDFIINLQTSILSGSLSAGGATQSGVNFFDLSPNGANYDLTLDPQLAGILASAFTIPDLTGATIGVASVESAPEPASLALSAAGFLITAVAIRKKLRA